MIFFCNRKINELNKINCHYLKIFFNSKNSWLRETTLFVRKKIKVIETIEVKFAESFILSIT